MPLSVFTKNKIILKILKTENTNSKLALLFKGKIKDFIIESFNKE
ncbi:MAG: hypothetical protein KatS3mg129_0221 [Leptospiraceae bacterium]|nr:MAG: hypothetical protein KatS3mg129_0221 [Leptospiraceae bacterium]